MLFSKQLPLASLIEFCRALRHNLAAGLTLRQVFHQQAAKGPVPVRPVAQRMARGLERGESFEDVLAEERAYFPPIFLSLGTVGEQTGSLPEVLAELEKYFLLQQRLWRQFVAQITWPVIELIVAIFVISAMILLIAILSPPGRPPWDPLGFGLTGKSGAARFLIYAFGSLALLLAAYLILTRTLKQKAAVDRFLLHVPVIGPCLSAIALMRFCTALRLTMETALPITTGVELSMRATGNAAFASRADAVCATLRRGEDLAEGLRRSRVFPEGFVNILANAEEAGRVPEVMHHQAEFYQEEARRRMTILTQTASWGIYAAVAALIIFIIFRIALSYIGLLNPSRYGI